MPKGENLIGGEISRPTQFSAERQPDKYRQPDTITALRALSNAVLTTEHTGEIIPTSAPLASSALYPDLGDAWVITGVDAAVYHTQLYVPAPLASLTGEDLLEYDDEAAEWVAVDAGIAALYVPYSGNPILSVATARIARAAPDIFQRWFNFAVFEDWERRTLQWSDIHGNARLTHLIGRDGQLGNNFDVIMDAFQDISAAVVTHYWEGAMPIYTDSPVSDPYASVNDAARITFADDLGNQTDIIIPAPLLAMFYIDGKTVEVGSEVLSDLIAAVTSECIVPISGRAVVSCVGGVLTHRTLY